MRLPASICAVALLAASCSRSSDRATSSSAAAPAAQAPRVQQAKAKRVVEGDDLSITEHESGQVSIKGIDQWSEKVDTTYSDCDYFQRAIPVMQRQFGKARAPLLQKVCVSP